MFRVRFAPIIRGITAAYSHKFCMVLYLAQSSEQFSLQEAQHYTTQAAFQVWPPKSGSCVLILLLMMDILVPETC
jgi:hypothetical protein